VQVANQLFDGDAAGIMLVDVDVDRSQRLCQRAQPRAR
jgi:hypothetical protein